MIKTSVELLQEYRAILENDEPECKITGNHEYARLPTMYLLW